MAVNPVVGCKNFKYAKLLTDPSGGTPTYDTVYSIEAIKSFSYNSASSMSRAYGDNGVVASAENVGDQTISIDFNDIPNADYERLCGFSYVNGVLAKNKDDISPYFAVGAEVTLDDGNSILVWFPKVKFMKPGQEATTKEASVSYQGQMMEGAVNNLSANGNYQLLCRSDDASVPAGTITGWFNSPVFADGASLTAVTVGTITGNSTAKTITVPFAKSGETFGVSVPGAYDITVSVVSTGVLLAGTSTYAVSAQGTAPTITISNTNIAAVAYLVTVSNRINDNNGVRVTPKSQLVTPA